MGGSCCVLGCKTRKGNNLNIVLFGFPKDLKRRRVWEIGVKRANWEPKNHSRICQESMFIPKVKGKLRLMPDAVPRIFPHSKPKPARKPPFPRGPQPVVDPSFHLKAGTHDHAYAKTGPAAASSASASPASAPALRASAPPRLSSAPLPPTLATLVLPASVVALLAALPAASLPPISPPPASPPPVLRPVSVLLPSPWEPDASWTSAMESIFEEDDSATVSYPDENLAETQFSFVDVKPEKASQVPPSRLPLIKRRKDQLRPVHRALTREPMDLDPLSGR